MRLTSLIVVMLFGTLAASAQRVGIERLTYWGGTGKDNISASALAPNGDVVVCGWTEASDMLTTENAYQRKRNKGVEGFIARFSSDGALIASTYIGGFGNDYPASVTIEADGNIVIVMSTNSKTLPITAQMGSGKTDDDHLVVVRMSPLLSELRASFHLMYSRSFYNLKIQATASGALCLSGATTETKLPTTVNAHQGLHGGGQDGFIMVLYASLDGIEYCTYDGGSRNDGIAACIDRGADGMTIVGFVSTYDQFGDIRLLKLNKDFDVVLDTIYQTPNGEVADQAVMRTTYDSTIFVAGFKGPFPLRGYVMSIDPLGTVQQIVEVDSNDLSISASYPFFTFARGMTLDVGGRVVVSGSSNKSARSIVFDWGLNTITERYEISGSGQNTATIGWVTSQQTLLMVGTTSSSDLPTSTTAPRSTPTDGTTVSEGFIATLRLLPSLYFTPTVIDLGTVPIGGSKIDSTLARVVNSRYPMHVDTIIVERASSDLVVDPPRSFWVYLGDNKPITVHWTPTRPGPLSAMLRVVTGDVAFYVNVIGNGNDTTTPAPTVTVSPIDFGTVRIGRNRERTTRITNTSKVDVVITEIMTDAAAPFSAMPATLPFTLSPGAFVDVPVKFAPGDTGVATTVLDVVGSGSVFARTWCRGVGGRDTITPLPAALRVSVGIDTSVVRIGQSFDYPIVVRTGLDSMRNIGVECVSFRYTYRRTILTVQSPFDSTSGTSEVRSIYVKQDWDATSDTMAVIRMTACMGDVNRSAIVVDDLQFTTDLGDVVMDTSLTSMILIDDPWQGPDPRVIGRDTLQPSLEAHPNPVQDRGSLRLHNVSPDATLHIYDVHGILLTSWISSTTSGLSDVHVALPVGLPSGAYVCIYRSNGGVVTYRFIVL